MLSRYMRPWLNAVRYPALAVTKRSPLVAYLSTNASPINVQYIEADDDTSATNVAATSAFSVRLGLRFNDPALLTQTLTHKSFQSGQVPHNASLVFVGQRALGLYVTEHLHIKYPNLPTDALNKTIGAYVSYHSLSKLAKETGLQHVIRWSASTQETGGHVSDKVLAEGVAAIVGAIYREHGSHKAKKFVRDFVLSRDVDISQALEFKEPKRYLSRLMERQGKDKPVSRLLKETGRLSHAPLFLVGVFSGENMLGQGHGSSLKMAEFRAAKDALQKYYLQQTPEPFKVPSDADYTPQKVGDSEIIV
ncbi:hypothetical protein BZG36_03654 [Bifiguratus adelaidae]|uniref:Large ribosomal subunit protein mL44 n=1 Tax=Bifiguratus adelaidae TaxID=1938954 RepID=A0A261XW43_9FUNG|nr:hypothetical protein BZG36_03654 [Bifiguratus adelaidae]